jgi:kynurenine formamidase
VRTPGRWRRWQGLWRREPQPFECHIKLQTKRGIWNMENLNLNQLVADKAYEFLFVWSPLKMKGATGSPGNPVALY